MLRNRRGAGGVPHPSRASSSRGPIASSSSSNSIGKDCYVGQQSNKIFGRMSASDFVDMLIDFLMEDNDMYVAIEAAILEQIEADMQPRVPRHRMHTSTYNGHAWMNDILNGHVQRCYNILRLHPNMFRMLRDMLVTRNLIADSRYVSADEQLAMFLLVAGHGHHTSALCKRMQHSSQTISHYVNKVTFALASLKYEFIVLPTASQLNDCHPRISGSERYYPYFKHVIGAIDGTHIPAHIAVEDQARFRNRKQQITQNIMAAVSFDMLFQYVCVGYEGSAADMEVLKWCILKGGFTVPPGKHYLVDGGYANTTSFLAPYRGQRYHLDRFRGRGNQPYANKQEKYNHRHAELRNVVERSFGVLKMRFQTLHKGNMYPWPTQRAMVAACCVVHNFIRREHGYDFYFNDVREDYINDEGDSDEGVPPESLMSSTAVAAGEVLREGIADQIWATENR